MQKLVNIYFVNSGYIQFYEISFSKRKESAILIFKMLFYYILVKMHVLSNK